MTYVEVLLAKKYAAAYLNIHGASVDVQSLSKLESLQDYLQHEQDFLVMLNLPIIGLALKKDKLKKVLHAYAVSESLLSLMYLVVSRSRALLLPEILKQIRLVYYERHKIMQCVIATSHPVTQSALEIIQRFITRKTGWSIVYSHVVDPTLIAGIRVTSDSMVWEYSISKQLNNVSVSLIR